MKAYVNKRADKLVLIPGDLVEAMMLGQFHGNVSVENPIYSKMLDSDQGEGAGLSQSGRLVLYISKSEEE